MVDSTSELDNFLDELARHASPGDRVPTVRELMGRFGVSQMRVQRAFQSLKADGVIASQVGRGTYFRAAGAHKREVAAQGGSSPVVRAPGVRSVLLLRRSISVARGRVLGEALQRRFAEDGQRVLELSYTDPEHARIVLKGLPHFDACVIQSGYMTIPIDLLTALRHKSDVIAVDGAALVGADVEAVGMEWGEPLAAAVSHLEQSGHRRIAYATTTHPFLATQLARRRFDQLQQTSPHLDLQLLSVPHLPDGPYEEALIETLKASLDASGRPPFTALVAWGIENGARFRASLSGIGLAVPASMSVVLLGRTDLANEHAGFFDTIGCSVADQADALFQAINARWADPTIPYSVRLIPVTRRGDESTAAPAKVGKAEATGARKPVARRPQA